MDNSKLYINVKNKICRNIFYGAYKDGENIPPERVLAKDYNVSRVTIRKALELLQNEGILERVQGRGNIVRLSEAGYDGTMDIIALLAPAQNPFFASFIDFFQRNADKNDSLVLFMQNPRGKRVEYSLFNLLQKNIRNAVIWLEDLELDIEYIRRLRGLGMNMVFFDVAIPMPYADCVLLDNCDAITALYDYLQNKGAKKIGYIGWDNLNLTSVKERENSFIELHGDVDNLIRIPWSDKNSLPGTMEKFINKLKTPGIESDGIICGDGEIGIALKKELLKQGIKNIDIVCVDDFPEAESLSLTTYMQDLDKLARRVYDCLHEQNVKSVKWKAFIYRIKGRLIKR